MSENDRYGDSTDRLKYLNMGELREEIVYVVGGDPSRYGADSRRGLRRADMERIAGVLKPDENSLSIHQCTLGKLYEVSCRWSGAEYQPNAGNPWKLNRDNLKQIHRTVGGRDPREEVAADD